MILFDGKKKRTNRVRYARISSHLTRMVGEYMNSHGSPFLFSSRQAEKITCRRVRQIVQFYCAKIGLGHHTTPQILRYTHIAHAMMKRIPLSSIQRQVGIGKARALEIFDQVSGRHELEAYDSFLEEQHDT